MHIKHLSSMLREDITTVAVSFVTGRLSQGHPHVYKVLKTDAVGLAVNDMVVAPTGVGSAGEDHYGVGRIMEVHTLPQLDPTFPDEYKWIVAKVDRTKYFQTLAHENELEDVIAEIEGSLPDPSPVEQFLSLAQREMPEAAARLEQLRVKNRPTPPPTPPAPPAPATPAPPAPATPAPPAPATPAPPAPATPAPPVP